jgi:hypothetical protein
MLIGNFPNYRAYTYVYEFDPELDIHAMFNHNVHKKGKKKAFEQIRGIVNADSFIIDRENEVKKKKELRAWYEAPKLASPEEFDREIFEENFVNMRRVFAEEFLRKINDGLYGEESKEAQKSTVQHMKVSSVNTSTVNNLSFEDFVVSVRYNKSDEIVQSKEEFIALRDKLNKGFNDNNKMINGEH